MRINNYCYYSKKVDGNRECRHTKNVGCACYYDECPLLGDDGTFIEKFERDCDGDPVDRYYLNGEMYTLECE